jgi:hypothetical protein
MCRSCGQSYMHVGDGDDHMCGHVVKRGGRCHDVAFYGRACGQSYMLVMVMISCVAIWLKGYGRSHVGVSCGQSYWLMAVESVFFFVPFMIRSRRMLEGLSGKGGAGLGFTIEMLRRMLKKVGVAGVVG